MNSQHDILGYCKQLRYVGNNKFNNPIILDVDFDTLFPYLCGIENIIGYNNDRNTIGKPRFNCLFPSTHCDYPILSKDYYLIGFTDSLNSDSAKFKFACGAGNEYLKNSKILRDSIEFINFGEKEEFNNLNYIK